MLGDGCPGTGYHGSNGWEEECIVMQTVKVSTFLHCREGDGESGEEMGGTGKVVCKSYPFFCV